jgi:hypothetical protein
LVRYDRGSLPVFDDAGQPLDVTALCGGLGDSDSPQSWAASVCPKGRPPIPGRLVAVRLPPDKAEQARTRLRRERGPKTTPAALALAEFVVLWTTIPETALSAALILKLYTLRWQVELSFKRDKSLGGLDCLPNFRPDTIYTWLVANLLLGQIATQIATSPVSFPPGGLRDIVPAEPTAGSETASTSRSSVQRGARVRTVPAPDLQTPERPHAAFMGR